ncbi:MAG TPA: hypothetical protein DCX14_13040 [Flavobacteriales bacterium]|nr:hypothetical protein [Flavobacteriales bacterium]
MWLNAFMDSPVKHIIRLLAILVLGLLANSPSAQQTIVVGKVFEAETNLPIPFANVYFKDSKIGTTTDEKGAYRIETYYPTDSLLVTVLGYQRGAQRVKADRSQVVDFEMKISGISLGPVTIVADKKAKDPAIEIMKKVIRNKKANNREKLEAYEYNVYNKIEFDMNNINERFTNQKVMKPFDFVFENIDSTSEEKPFLPIFLTESFSRYYYRKSPKSSMEHIKATKVAGVKNESVSQFLGDMYQNTNVYENYVDAFGKSFMSPLSDFGGTSYKYYLLDSAVINRKKCFKIAFIPRRKGELVFEGEMWINDTTYALKEIQAKIIEGANINWINSFSVHHVYDQVENEIWMLTKENVVVDFNLSEKAIGFYGRKTTIYDEFIINEKKENSFYSTFNNIQVADSANDMSDEFWNEKRPESLSENEFKVYEMVDTIQQIRAFRTYVDLITLFVNGHYEMKYVDIGPYFTMASFNQVEGLRLRVGGRTNSDFSTRLELSGYLAYGTKDQRFKYHAASRFFISKSPRQIIHLSTRKDLEQLGQSANAWRTDNILSSVFRRAPFRFNAYEEYKGGYEVEFIPGFSTKFEFGRKDIWSVGDVLFQRENGDGSVYDINRISTAEVGINVRFAYRESFISGDLDRISLGTKFPILEFNARLGIKGFLGGDYEYQRVSLRISDRFPINPIGQSEFILEAGKIWGTVPYPLLQMFPGNQTYFYDDYAYNLMNYYEFISDQWVTLFYTHHFNGLFFNKVPLFRKLKWREVATMRSAIGGLSNKHKAELQFPANLYDLNKPYFEAGVGVENILKIFRVDAIWRLSYLSNPNVVPFGVRLTFQIEF